MRVDPAKHLWSEAKKVQMLKCEQREKVDGDAVDCLRCNHFILLFLGAPECNTNSQLLVPQQGGPQVKERAPHLRCKKSHWKFVALKIILQFPRML